MCRHMSQRVNYKNSQYIYSKTKHREKEEERDDKGAPKEMGNWVCARPQKEVTEALCFPL